MLLFRKP